MNMKWGKTLETQLIPFRRNITPGYSYGFNEGDQLTYYDAWDKNVELRPNEVFADTLEYVTYHRGRSSALFEFKRLSTRTNVFMFMTDIDDIIPLMVGGKLGGTFTFCKRGKNYGVKMLSEVKSGNV